MSSRPERFRTGLLAVAVVGLAARGALADSGIAMEVVCPALDAESLAAFEARAHVDLSLRVSRGALAVTCDGAEAHLVWRDASATPHEVSVPLPADRAGRVDAMLAALAEITATPVATAAPASSASTTAPASSIAGATPTPTPTGRRPAEPDGADPKAEALPREAPAGSGTSELPAAFGLFVGGSTELWGRGIPAAAGPHVGVTLLLPGGIALGLRGGARFGIGSSLGVSAYALDGAASADVWLGPKRSFELGAGALASDLRASAASPLSPGDRSTPMFGAFVRARWALVLPPFRIAVGPELRAWAGDATARVGAEDAFHVPSLTGALTIDATWLPAREAQ